MVGTTGRGAIAATARGVLRVGLVPPVLRVVVVVGLATQGSGIHAHADELPFKAHAQIGHPMGGVMWDGRGVGWSQVGR